MKPRQKRPHTLRVVVSDDERAAIAANAKLTRLSVSSYLRRLATGHEPKTRLDHERIRDLIRVRGDIGRVGGLLKLWLTERPGEGASVEDIRAILDDIEQIAADLAEKVRQL